jgi:hypothetical protein
VSVVSPTLVIVERSVVRGVGGVWREGSVAEEVLVVEEEMTHRVRNSE